MITRDLIIWNFTPPPLMAVGEVVRQIYRLVNILSSSFLLPPSAFDFVLACGVDHPSPMMESSAQTGRTNCCPPLAYSSLLYSNINHNISHVKLRCGSKNNVVARKISGLVGHRDVLYLNLLKLAGGHGFYLTTFNFVYFRSHI